MACPICAWTYDNHEYRFLNQTSFWRVVLAPNQALLGRCVVHLKRHAGDLADLTQEECLDWLAVARDLEAALSTAFGATMFNWSCYMNHAYRDDTPDPHVHWWAVPRYKHPVTLGGWTFTDPTFGSPYDHNRWQAVPAEISREIADRIRRALDECPEAHNGP